jgi:carbon monoxide dehydrogenase subunit G
MASIRKEILIDARPEQVWDALRDVGALHERVVPGFVVDTRLEEGARIVTAIGGPLTHHNASVQVFADGTAGSRLVWIADLLPHDVAGDIRAMIEQAATIMKPTLERG